MAPKKASRRDFGYIRERRGQFQASYKRDGKTHYAPHQFLDRAQARVWLNGEQSLILQGRWTPPDVVSPLNTKWTFGSFAEYHLNVHVTSKGLALRPAVQETYRRYLRTGLANLACMPLELVTKSVVDEWYAARIAKGKVSVASKQYKFLRSVMQRAIDSGYVIGLNPCQIRGAQNASTNVQILTPTMTEVGLMARSINPRFSNLVLVMANAGLRFGEATALIRSDVSFFMDGDRLRATLNVERAVVRLRDNSIHIGPPKSADGVRKISLNSALTEIVSNQLASLQDVSETALLFPSSKGTYLRNDVLNKAMKAAARRSKLDPKAFSPHCLRRAGATEFANQGANMAEIKEFLGDASEKAAMRYIKTTGRTESLIQKMNTGINEATQTPA